MQSVTRPRDLRARIVIGAVLPLLLAISACSATKAPSSKPAQEAGYIVVTMQPQLERLFGDDLLQRRGLAQPLDVVGGGGAGRVARQAAPAGFEELVRPHVIPTLRNPLTAAQLGDAVLAAQAVEQDPDLDLSQVMLARGAANVLHHPFTGRFLGNSSMP